MNSVDDSPRAAVPADVAEPDRIAFGLTFRQLAIIGGPGLAALGCYRLFGPLLPPPVWAVAGLLLFAVAVTVALGRRDGLPLQVWLRHGVTFARSPRVFTPGAARPSPVVVVADAPRVPAPLRSPVTSISPAGVLTSEGSPKVLIACGTTNLHLRTGAEQEALLDGFGRFLNGLTGPVQLLVSAQRHDLTGYAQATADAAARLPHPALQTAAEDHAAFLADLDAERDPLRRHVLAVVTGEHTTENAVRALTSLGVAAAALDGAAVTAALTAAVDPYHPPAPGPRAVPGTPITVRSSR
ncbi:PrgI family protein [Mangrovihabitans endophyticus]|uniref:PrgI family protein n=1 Tax=Mangrovihabitans endophyticus TaxID=1751298 RepID=A0A8J3FSZ0_9ACTN|nr:PrgI family protein [Mangrovihabitans endophyticus]GGL20194.1 hypothetical protein GCM10012284_63530 [Mangrovihabitans endophyticus]